MAQSGAVRSLEVIAAASHSNCTPCVESLTTNPPMQSRATLLTLASAIMHTDVPKMNFSLVSRATDSAKFIERAYGNVRRCHMKRSGTTAELMKQHVR